MISRKFLKEKSDKCKNELEEYFFESLDKQLISKAEEGYTCFSFGEEVIPITDKLLNKIKDKYKDLDISIKKINTFVKVVTISWE